MKTQISVIGLLLVVTLSYSQTEYKLLVEFQAQRYLINELYQISSTEIDELRIDQIYTEYDSEFILEINVYDFNGSQGVVLTSMNTYDVIGDVYKIVNIHLTKEGFQDFNNRLSFMQVNLKRNDMILIQRFNDRLIFEVTPMRNPEFVFYNLWVDNTTRHIIRKEDWFKAYQRFEKFFHR